MIPRAVIYEAKNGREAFEMAISKKPNLIIMDIQMPEMSGIEATMSIRNYEIGKGRRIPIIALTAGALKGEKEKCLEAGMDDFLTKPLDNKRLRRILETYLHSRKEISNFKEITSEHSGNIHFDRMMVLESIGNSEVILEELLEAAQVQFAQDILRLRIAIEEQNLSNIKMLAHSIKGASLNMYFNKMAELAIEFELYLDKGHISELNDLFAELVVEWKHLQALLRTSVE